jgi:hypothetical protein
MGGMSRMTDRHFDFLHCSTIPQEEGKIILSRNGKKTGKKYIIKQWDGAL